MSISRLIRILFIILTLVGLLGIVWSFAQIPVVKVETVWAVDQVEKNYLRGDLTRKDREDYEFWKRWILWNQQGTTECLIGQKLRRWLWEAFFSYRTSF